MYCFILFFVVFLCIIFSNYFENFFVVLVELVCKKLLKLNLCKVNGLDNIFGWLLKENVDILVGLVFDILNYLYCEGCLLLLWKYVDVVFVLK